MPRASRLQIKYRLWISIITIVFIINVTISFIYIDKSVFVPHRNFSIFILLILLTVWLLLVWTIKHWRDEQLAYEMELQKAYNELENLVIHGQ